jgi:hypothetical protein
LAAQAYLNYDVEFHCAEMIDPRKQGAYQQLSIADRWKLINMFAETIAERMGVGILAVVIDKTKTHLVQENYFTSSITALYQAYDEFLRHEKANGLVLFDRANEKAATTHVRKLLGTGATGQKVPNVSIGWVIEDPIYRVSADSFFIQAADIVAYALKEQEFPIGSRKKYNADRIFKNWLQKPCIRTSQSGHDGVIRL